jgi:hypothetical protein
LLLLKPVRWSEPALRTRVSFPSVGRWDDRALLGALGLLNRRNIGSFMVNVESYFKSIGVGRPKSDAVYVKQGLKKFGKAF